MDTTAGDVNYLQINITQRKCVHLLTEEINGHFGIVY